MYIAERIIERYDRRSNNCNLSKNFEGFGANLSEKNVGTSTGFEPIEVFFG